MSVMPRTVRLNLSPTDLPARGGRRLSPARTGSGGPTPRGEVPAANRPTTTCATSGRGCEEDGDATTVGGRGWGGAVTRRVDLDRQDPGPDRQLPGGFGP